MSSSWWQSCRRPLCGGVKCLAAACRVGLTRNRSIRAIPGPPSRVKTTGIMSSHVCLDDASLSPFTSFEMYDKARFEAHQFSYCGCAVIILCPPSLPGLFLSLSFPLPLFLSHFLPLSANGARGRAPPSLSTSSSPSLISSSSSLSLSSCP